MQIDSNDLRELLAFVHTYAHLYETLNVEFFSARVYERIDAEWLSFMCRLDNAQLNMLPTEFEQYTDCPASLRQFFVSARRLSLLDKYSTTTPAAAAAAQNRHGYCTMDSNDSILLPGRNAKIVQQQLRKVKQKKAHELAAFSELLLAECAPPAVGIDRVVDIGCGLGHLGRVLRLNNNNNCSSSISRSSPLLDYVGIEANPALCHSALKNELKMENFVFGAGGDEHDNTSSSKQCREILTVPGRRTAIVSLHGCGELQRQILLEFVAMCKQQQQQKDSDHPQLLVTVGCCYHKLKNWTESAIDRWMLSAQMREHFVDAFGGHHRFPIAGLRLACQAKLISWTAFTDQQHAAHRQAFANRAFLECLGMNKMTMTTTARPSSSSAVKTDDDNCGGDGEADLLKPNRRHRPSRTLNKSIMTMITTNKNNNNNSAWDDVLLLFREEMLRRCAVLAADEERAQFEQKLDKIMATFGPAIPFIEPFTALQFALQCPLESLVLLDRLLFLRENGIDADLVRLFDPAISPRNIAIVGRAHTRI